MMNKIMNFIREEEGSNAAEYALIIALVATVLVIGAGALGTAINNKLDATATEIAAAR